MVVRVDAEWRHEVRPSNGNVGRVAATLDNIGRDVPRVDLKRVKSRGAFQPKHPNHFTGLNGHGN
jgi:hypothetical protein